jgi:hypothetical protein
VILRSSFFARSALTFVTLIGLSCNDKTNDGRDEKVTTLGTIEVTAQLEAIPGEFPPNDLYDYAYVLRYRVLETHRGQVDGDTILVAQYNPLKPRAEAADDRAKGIGGTLHRVQAGDVHRMALDVPFDDHYMGPSINKYEDAGDQPIHWAVWTNEVVR